MRSCRSVEWNVRSMRTTCVTSRYLPNLWHLVRLCEVDQAVVLDLASLPDRNRDSFVNRNRIWNPGAQSTQWITVPVLRRRGQSVGATPINPTDHRWATKHIAALRYCYPQHEDLAPGFLFGLEQVLFAGHTRLLELNLAVLSFLLKSLEVAGNFPLLESTLVSTHGPEHRLDIASKLGATEYLAGAVEWQLLEGSSQARRFEESGVRLVRTPPLLYRSGRSRLSNPPIGCSFDLQRRPRSDTGTREGASTGARRAGRRA